jgi:hypothetical protein
VCVLGEKEMVAGLNFNESNVVHSSVLHTSEVIKSYKQLMQSMEAAMLHHQNQLAADVK